MKSLVAGLLRLVGSLVPDGKPRERLWRALLRWRPTVPKELMAGRGDFIVQVGTPFPETITRLSRMVGPLGKVVVIEPAPANLERLSACIENRGLANVEIVAKAAWNQTGNRTLLLAPRAADHRLELDSIAHDNDLLEDGYPSKSVVEVDTVDNILAPWTPRRIDFVEIAVNGAELQVLAGMERSLAETRRLFVKGHARDTETSVPIHRAIAEHLRKRGFRTLTTRESASVAEEWGPRQGDVYAWRLGDPPPAASP